MHCCFFCHGSDHTDPFYYNEKYRVRGEVGTEQFTSPAEVLRVLYNKYEVIAG